MVSQLVFEFDKEKNALLKKTRGVNFEDVAEAVKGGALIDNIEHPNRTRYPHQKMLVVEISGYVYSVPYVEMGENRVFLKTLYPNRKLNKAYRKK